jgi:hypothetical protein
LGYQVHNPLVLGSLNFGTNLTDFPANPALNTFATVNDVLYVYTSLKGISSWFTVLNLGKSYVHRQAVANNTWTIAHNLNSMLVMVSIVDADYNQVAAGYVSTDENTVTVDFGGSPATGYALIVAPDDITAPHIEADYLTIGAVEITGNNITINGQDVLVAGNFVTEAAFTTAMANKANTSDIPVVPTLLSAFSNDPSYQTLSQVNASIQAVIGADPVALKTLAAIDAALANDESAAAALTTVVAGKANISSVPTHISQLTNDSGYALASAILTKTSQLANDAGFITISSVPTVVSQLSNDSGYLSSVPVATSSVSGTVKGFGNLTINNGTLSLTGSNVTAALGYTPLSTLAIAAAGTLGGVKGFTNLTVDGSGNISMTAANIAAALTFTPQNASTALVLASTGTPAALGAAALGSATTAAKSDHVHALPFALTTTVTPAALASSAAVGSSGTAAQADHVHALPSYATLGPAIGLVDALTANATTNGAITINCGTTTYYKATLSGNVSGITFSNVPSAGAFTLSLQLTQDGTGSRTVTWPGSVKWAGGVAPTLTTAAGKTDFIALMTPDGGTTWYGFVGGQNF